MVRANVFSIFFLRIFRHCKFCFATKRREGKCFIEWIIVWKTPLLPKARNHATPDPSWYQVLDSISRQSISPLKGIEWINVRLPDPFWTTLLKKMEELAEVQSVSQFSQVYVQWNITSTLQKVLQNAFGGKFWQSLKAMERRGRWRNGGRRTPSNGGIDGGWWCA